MVEAATVVAAGGWWTFRNVDGHSLATLPTSDVLSIEAIPAAHRAWAAHGRVLPLRPAGRSPTVGRSVVYARRFAVVTARLDGRFRGR